MSLPTERIFPDEIVKFSEEYHYSRYRVKGKPLYKIVILLFIVTLIAIPLINIDITYSARGILRTPEEPCILRMPLAGEICTNNIKLHSRVLRGDTLLVLDRSTLDSKIRNCKSSEKLVRSYIRDIELIITNNSPFSSRYKQINKTYQGQLRHIEYELDHAENVYRTQSELFREDCIARIEFQAAQRSYEQAKENLEIFRLEYRSKLENELSAYKLQLNDIENQKVQLLQQEESAVLIAPVNGRVSEYRHLSIGSYLFINQHVATIIPDAELIAEVMVTTDKISRIHPEQRIKISVDAFPGSSYGRLEGTVSAIPEDARQIEKQSFYSIQCRIPEQEFPSGHQNTTVLRSGMSVNCLFILTRKSLLQLLTEKGEHLFTEMKM